MMPAISTILNHLGCETLEMKTCLSCTKWICLVIVTISATILYFVLLLRTYDTTVDKAKVDISFDVFERKQRIQQQRHLALVKEFTKTLKADNADKTRIAKDGVFQAGTKKVEDYPNHSLQTEHDAHIHMLQKQAQDVRPTGHRQFEKGKGTLNGDQLYPPHLSIFTNVTVKHMHSVPSLGTKMEVLPESRHLESIFSSGNISIKYTENVDTGSGAYKSFWVDSEGPLLHRVTSYNAAIHNLRKQLIKERGDRPWQSLSGVMESFWCNRDDFHKELERYPAVKTVSLSWYGKMVGKAWNSSVDAQNLLLQEYYSWSGSELLCKWVRTAGLTRARWDAVYNRTCKTLLNVTSPGRQKLDPVYLHGKPINKKHYWPNHGIRYPQYFYTTTPPQVLYLHVMEDAVVTSLGDVITGNLKLVPYSCSQDVDAAAPPNFHISPLYDEVFVMGQYWGASFFHMMVENLPRLAPYLEFLKANPTVMIHAQAVHGYTAQSLELLGLSRRRLIKGTIRAQRVYLSQATPCGFANLPGIQILAHHYRNYLHSVPALPLHHRPSVLLIRRSGSRRFTQHQRIRDELETIAMEFDLEFEMFIDNPSPPMQAAMWMFNRAALVVGPHGAGLSNLVYCQPGTLIIEGVCNPPHVNMCYQWTAHVLGLRYHSIGSRYHSIGSRGGCETWVDVDYVQVSTAARHLLKTSVKRTL